MDYGRGYSLMDDGWIMNDGLDAYISNATTRYVTATTTAYTSSPITEVTQLTGNITVTPAGQSSSSALVSATVGAFFGGVFLTVIISLVACYLIWKFKIHTRVAKFSKRYKPNGNGTPTVNESVLEDGNVTDRNHTDKTLQHSYEQVTLEVNHDFPRCYEDLTSASKNMERWTRQSSHGQSSDYQYQDPVVATAVAKSRDNSVVRDQYFILEEPKILPEWPQDGGVGESQYFVLEQSAEQSSEESQDQIGSNADQYFILEKTDDDADDDDVTEEKRVTADENTDDGQYFVLEKIEASQTESENDINDERSPVTEERKDLKDPQRGKLVRDPTYKNYTPDSTDHAHQDDCTDSLAAGTDSVTSDACLDEEKLPNQLTATVKGPGWVPQDNSTNFTSNKSNQTVDHKNEARRPKRPKRPKPQPKQASPKPNREQVTRAGTGTYQNVTVDTEIPQHNETEIIHSDKEPEFQDTPNKLDLLRAPTYQNYKAERISNPKERRTPESLYSNLSEMGHIEKDWSEQDTNQKLYENC